MADFEKAFPKIMKAEGGYVNDPRDRGGETFIGIARKFHRNSSIWKYVDEVKTRTKSPKEIDKILKAIPEVMKEVKRIYKTNYWDPLKLDHYKSQAIAYQFFDDAVNRGVASTIKLMQRIAKVPITGKMTKELEDYFINYVGKDNKVN